MKKQSNYIKQKVQVFENHSVDYIFLSSHHPNNFIVATKEGKMKSIQYSSMETISQHILKDSIIGMDINPTIPRIIFGLESLYVICTSLR